MEKNLIDPRPEFLIELSLNKMQSNKAKIALINLGFLSNSPKKNEDLPFLSVLTIKELLNHYKEKNFVKARLRKILKKKLLYYENVGFNERKDLWYQASDAKLAQNSNPKEYYEILRDKFKNIPQKFDEIIELDLLRTTIIPEDQDPKSREILNKTLMKCGNVLRTYVKRNPDLGYCQGLNYIIFELISRFDNEVLEFLFFYVFL